MSYLVWMKGDHSTTNLLLASCVWYGSNYVYLGCMKKIISQFIRSLGHRTYSAYQPASLIEKLSTGLKVLEKQGGEIANGKAQQQVWLFTK